MSLSKALNQITVSGFNKMPSSIAKVLSDGIEELKTKKLASNALQPGDTIPDVKLAFSNGIKRTLLSQVISQPFMVLNFYRGGWCPYCNLELRAYEQFKEQFEEVGAGIISISAELPQYALATTNRNKLSHPVLSDVDAELSKAIGIAFTLNKDLLKEYTNFGIDLSELHGDDENNLLVPAVFIIDRNMKIVWSHIEENYMTRAEPADVLKALQGLEADKN